MRILRFAAGYFFRRAERRRKNGLLAAAIRDYARAARQGYAPAQHGLGRAYQIGQGCVRSGALAKYWYEAAAEAGYIDAQFELGLILLNKRDPAWFGGPSATWLNHRADHERSLVAALFPAGVESESDPAAGFSWLSRAAEAGKVEAQANVGWLRLMGIGCTKDRVEAHRWLAAAAAHNVGQAALGLARYYGTKEASDHNPTQSAVWAKKASELGNASGSHCYGVALRDGNGIERNLVEAERYFSLAVEQGHPTAAYDAAILSLTQSPSLAKIQAITEQLRLCAKRDHIPSALLLADLYGRADWAEPDRREVAYWYRVAADLGDVKAQFLTGCLYARGEGVELDLKHAVRYFGYAANRGHTEAAFNLGVFRLNGHGVEQNVAEAKRLLNSAAEAGLAEAQLLLGQIVEREAATPLERDYAKSLIEKASNAGNNNAKIMLARMLLADGTSDSEQKALGLLRQAGNEGKVEACELLLSRVAAGPAFQDLIQTLHRLARSGNSSAKFVLGEALLKGEQVERNAAEALSLLNEAAADQDARAHFLLGTIHCQGLHVSKDVLRGYRHYLEAARHNHPLAQYNAGIMLLQGIGVEKNVEDAMTWMKRAANNNLQQAVEFIRKVEQGASMGNANA